MNALKFRGMICSKTRVERCDIFYKLMSYVRDRIPYDHDAKELYELIVELCHLNDTVDDMEFKKNKDLKGHLRTYKHIQAMDMAKVQSIEMQ